MSTSTYYSQMAPFWNWVAKVEEKGTSHPWFERRAKRAANRGETLETGSDGMAHFWEFVSKVEQEGPDHPWVKRRAANQAKREANKGDKAEGTGKPASTRTTEAETPKPQRNGRGNGRGPWGRPNRRQQAAQAEVMPLVTPDSEKVVDNEKTLEQLQSEADKVEVTNETRHGPGARRGGGRGGRGGRGQGLDRGRRAATLATGPNETENVSSGEEKAVSGDETVRGPGARRGGRGFGRGAGRGLGGPHGNVGPANMGFRRVMAMRPHAHHAFIAAPHLDGPAHGAGLGRGRGAGNFGCGHQHVRGLHAGHGPHMGPGFHHGGPMGRGGRGMGADRGRGAGVGRGRGAAAVGRGMNQGPARAFAGPHRGPGPNRQAGPNRGPQARRFGPMRGGRKTRTGAFIPLVDVFDHPESYMVHVSLPGAKKEDIEVNWDAEKSVLSISGNVQRPGDEELHKTLALKERRIGAFMRRVRLGGKAQVLVEDITARMEDGVLRVKIPKLEAGFVEVKKVDIF